MRCISDDRAQRTLQKYTTKIYTSPTTNDLQM